MIKKICVFVNQKFAVFQYIYGDYEGFGTILNWDESLTKELVNAWKE